VGYTSPLELEDLRQLPKEEKTEHQFKKFSEIYASEQVCRYLLNLSFVDTVDMIYVLQLQPVLPDYYTL
jgi:hypothetical protein